jgi:16S rRNA (guanine966-N2)-methyltransferase
LISVVSHAGPTFILARRRLKKPRTPGLSASFVMMQSLADGTWRDSAGAGPGAACDMMRRVTAPKSQKPAPGKRNSLRIIGGGWRGRRVHFPDSPGLRPTPDRVRETLFNWLQFSLAGARCLDLFAGSGALGLEALSRGAREVVFVDEATPVAKSLREELERLDGTARARVLQTTAARLSRAPGEPFDVIFLDPPFGTGRARRTGGAHRGRRLDQARRMGVPRIRAPGRRPAPAAGMGFG